MDDVDADDIIARQDFPSALPRAFLAYFRNFHVFRLGSAPTMRVMGSSSFL